MTWFAMLKSFDLAGTRTSPKGRKSRCPKAGSRRTILSVENLESRWVPTVAISATTAAIALTPPAPVVVVTDTVPSTPTAEFTASLELKGTVSESNGTATSSAHFDVTKTVNLTLVNGSAGAYLEHSDDFTLSVANTAGTSKLVMDFDLLGSVRVETETDGDEEIYLRVADTATLTQSGMPATADVELQGLLAIAPTGSPTATPLASMHIANKASVVTSTGDTTSHLDLDDGATQEWDVTDNSGSFWEHDTSELKEGGNTIYSDGPIHFAFDGYAGDLTPLDVGLDSKSRLDLGTGTDSANSKLALDVTGDFADFKGHGSTELKDAHGTTDAAIHFAVTGEVMSFDVCRDLSLTWAGGTGDTATDKEEVTIPAPITPTPAVVTTPTVDATLDSTFSLETAGDTYVDTRDETQSGPPIDFDIDETLPPPLPPTAPG